MRRLFTLLLFLCAIANAQNQQVNANLILQGYFDGNASTAIAPFPTISAFTTCPGTPANAWAQDASGNLYWCNAGNWQKFVTGATPAGTSGQIQTNNGSTLGALSLSGIPKLVTGVASGAAAFADIVGLFNGGTCSGYLASDGTCSTPSGTVGSGTAGQFAYYSGSGSSVAGRTLVAGDIPQLAYSSLSGLPTLGALAAAGYPSAGVVKSTGSAFGTSAASDIIALWTSCTSGYLAFNGTCSTPGGGSVPGGSTNSVQFNAGSSALGGVTLGNTQLLVGQTSAPPNAVTMSGDGTLSASGVLTLSGVPLSRLAAQAADSLVMNATVGSASPTAVVMPTCGAGFADIYSTSSHTWACISTGSGGNLGTGLNGANVGSNIATLGTNGTGQLVSVTPLGQVATQALSQFLNASDFSGRKVAYFGNSTVYGATLWYTTMAANLFPGTVFANLPIRTDIASVSTDASSNITVTMTGTVPSSWNGLWVSMELSGGGAIAVTGCVNSSGVITAVTSNTFTFPANINQCPSITNSLATGFVSINFLNFGNNGATAAAILANTNPAQTGIGGVCAAQPNFVIMRGPVINDVRQGLTNLSTATSAVASLISALNTCLPSGSQILLKTENSFLTTDVGLLGFVTAVSTTTTGAVGATGSQTVAVAQIENSMYVGGNVVVDSGGSQETVQITGMTGTYPGTGTITGVFTQTHSSGVTAVADLKSASQAYSNIIRLAVDAQINKFPNVVVLDTQGTLWGTTIYSATPPINLQTSTYMANQIHGSSLGYTQEAIEDLAVLTQVAGTTTYQNQANVAPIINGLPSQTGQTPFAPFLSQNASAQSSISPWILYPHACADTKYYTLVASGISGAATTVAAGQSFFRISMPGPQNVTIQNGDVFEQASSGCWNVATLSTTNASANLVQVTLTGATTPYTIFLGETINVWRPIYYNALAQPYVNNPVSFPYRRRVYIATGNAGTNFFRLTFQPSETGVTAAGSTITAADTVVFNTAGVQALTGGTFSASGGNLQVTLTGSFAGLIGDYGWVFGNHPFEQNQEVAYAVKPTLASFGTSPSVSGNNRAGRITVGTGGATAGVLTFVASPAYTNAPSCFANNETTSGYLQAVATTTTLTINGTMNAADKVPYACFGGY